MQRRPSIRMRVLNTRPSSSHTFALLTSSIPIFQIRTRRGAGGSHNVSWSYTELEGFSSRPTRPITHHQRCGAHCTRITESAKQKQRNHASLLSPTRPSVRFTRWARGSTSKTQSHDAGAAFGYATQAQQLFCFEVAVCFLCMPSHRTGPRRGTCGCAQGNVHCCTWSSNPARTCPGREWFGPSHLMLVDQTTWC